MNNFKNLIIKYLIFFWSIKFINYINLFINLLFNVIFNYLGKKTLSMSESVLNNAS